MALEDSTVAHVVGEDAYDETSDNDMSDNELGLPPLPPDGGATDGPFDLTVVTSLPTVTLWVSFVNNRNRIPIHGIKAFILDIPAKRRCTTVQNHIWSLLKHVNDSYFISRYSPDTHRLEIDFLVDDNNLDASTIAMTTQDSLEMMAGKVTTDHLRARVSFVKRTKFRHRANGGWRDVPKMLTVWRHDRYNFAF